MINRLLATLLFVQAVGCQTVESPRLFAEDDVFVTYDGKQYKLGDLPYDKQVEIHRLEKEAYDGMTKVAKDFVVDLYVAEKAKASGKPEDKAREDVLAIGPITEDDTERLYEIRRESLPFPYEQVKGELKSFIRNEREKEAKEKLITTIADERGAVIQLTPPFPPRFDIDTAAYPVIEKAPAAPAAQAAGDAVEIVQVVDYLCPHCRAAEATLKDIMTKLGRPVRLVALDKPPADDKESALYARGSWCAYKFGKYENYRSLAFASGGMAYEVRETIPEKLKQDPKAWTACLDSKEAVAYVKSSREVAKRLGAMGTPTFFVNGRRLEADLGLDAVKALVR